MVAVWCRALDSLRAAARRPLAQAAQGAGAHRRSCALLAGGALLLLPLALALAGCEDAEDAGAAGPPSGNAARGQRLLAQYQCGSCHAIPDVPAAQGGIGAPLSAFGRRSYIAGHIPNHAETLQRWIVEPNALVPGTLMPDMGVGDADARDMAAYLLSLR